MCSMIKKFWSRGSGFGQITRKPLGLYHLYLTEPEDNRNKNCNIAYLYHQYYVETLFMTLTCDLKNFCRYRKHLRVIFQVKNPLKLSLTALIHQMKRSYHISK